MDYPKMLYMASAPFADQKALEAGLVSGALKTLIVNSVDEEAAADGWTADVASLIGQPKKAKQ